VHDGLVLQFRMKENFGNYGCKLGWLLIWSSLLPQWEHQVDMNLEGVTMSVYGMSR
jgi:hypothetical protein